MAPGPSSLLLIASRPWSTAIGSIGWSEGECRPRGRPKKYCLPGKLLHWLRHHRSYRGTSFMQNSGQGVKSAVAKRQLRGHSGCHIFLMTYRNRTFIRKISIDHDYNVRLQRQKNIMISLASLGIPIPEGFGSGMENGKFYFDMEYINSTVLSKVGSHRPRHN